MCHITKVQSRCGLENLLFERVKAKIDPKSAYACRVGYSSNLHPNLRLGYDALLSRSGSNEPRLLQKWPDSPSRPRTRLHRHRHPSHRLLPAHLHRRPHHLAARPKNQASIIRIPLCRASISKQGHAWVVNDTNYEAAA